MRINFATLKSVPHYSSFGNNFDLSKELENVINKKLNGDNFDSFVPSSPSQPIIVEKLEINTKEKKGSGGIASGAGAGIVGSGVLDAVKDCNKETEQHENTDIDKIIDETAENNQNTKDDMSIDETDNFNMEDSDDDSGVDFDNIDDD